MAGIFALRTMTYVQHTYAPTPHVMDADPDMGGFVKLVRYPRLRVCRIRVIGQQHRPGNRLYRFESGDRCEGEGGEQFFKVPYQCCAGSRRQTPTIGTESQRTRVKIKVADGQHLSPVGNRPQRDRVILDAILGGKQPPVWTEYDCINAGTPFSHIFYRAKGLAGRHIPELNRMLTTKRTRLKVTASRQDFAIGTKRQRPKMGLVPSEFTDHDTGMNVPQLDFPVRCDEC